MEFELHIWGPAFGLPSIDPECLAAILYLDSRLDSQSYALNPSSDPFANPFGHLPAFRISNHAQPVWISGYRNIVRYFESQETTHSVLGKAREADCIAFSEYVQTRGRELVDLSLWVSSENYTTVTRSAMNELLQWPSSWTIPSRLRDEARARTEYLGLSGLDVDDAAEEQARKDLASRGLNGQIPDRLKKVNQTVSRLLGQGNRGHHFKLAALADNFLEMVAALRKKEDSWLLGTDHPTSLDCLTLGYLSLMNKADMPHDWLGFALRERFAGLVSWSEEQTQSVFGSPVRWVNGRIVVDTDSRLLWSPVSSRSWSDVGMSVMVNFTASLPLIGSAYLHPIVPLDAPDGCRPPETPRRRRSSPQQAIQRLKQDKLSQSQFTAFVLGLTTISGILYWIGLRLPSRPMTRAPRDFGAAGSMLGLR